MQHAEALAIYFELRKQFEQNKEAYDKILGKLFAERKKIAITAILSRIYKDSRYTYEDLSKIYNDVSIRLDIQAMIVLTIKNLETILQELHKVAYQFKEDLLRLNPEYFTTYGVFFSAKMPENLQEVFTNLDDLHIEISGKLQRLIKHNEYFLHKGLQVYYADIWPTLKSCKVKVSELEEAVTQSTIGELDELLEGIKKILSTTKDISHTCIIDELYAYRKLKL